VWYAGLDGILVGKLIERDSSAHLCVNRRIILKWILKKFGGWSGLISYPLLLPEN